MNRQQRLEKLGLGAIEPIAGVIHGSGEEYGLRSYAVGGLVRDALIGRESKDVDVCVAGDPIRMAQMADEILPRLSGSDRRKYEEDVQKMHQEDPSQPADLQTFLRVSGGGVLLALKLYLEGKTDFAPVLYPRFLVAMTKIGGEEVEFVATRSEDYSEAEGVGSRARNPGSIEVATEQEDALRRDFTANALYLNLGSGEVLDPTGYGKRDAVNRVIRVVRPDDPQKTFEDDPLRILRAIRQSAQLGFGIDNETWNVMFKMMAEDSQGLLGKLSNERIRDELSKMLLSDRPVKAMDQMMALGVMDVVLPEVAELKKMEKLNHKDIWAHTMKVIENVQITPGIEEQMELVSEKTGDDLNEIKKRTMLRLRLGALLHDIGKVSTRAFGSTPCPKCGGEVPVPSRMGGEVQCPNEIKVRDQKGRERTSPCRQSVNTPPEWLPGKTTFHQHDSAGAEMTSGVLNRLNFDGQMMRWVRQDVKLHQITSTNHKQEPDIPSTGQWHTQPKQTSIEKLVNSLADTTREDDPWGDLNVAVRLEGLIAADSSANPPAQRKRVDDLIERYQRAKEQRSEFMDWAKMNKPLVSGDELMQMFPDRGPGKWIGEVHERMRSDRLDDPEGHDVERARQIAREYQESEEGGVV